MINYLVGEIVLKSENLVVLEVNGIGYELNVSMFTLDNLPQTGSVSRVFTYMHVREDEISLFGFSSIDEKNVFLKLISVSGIGPKVALAILSGIKLSDLMVAIKTGDVKLLSTVKGLGKKTAERIVLELKDKISVVGFDSEVAGENIANESIIDEATEALIALGVNKNEAYRLARENSLNCETTEDIIRKAFQNLSN